MNNKLFVGNLPYSITNPQLEEMFSAYGKIVSVKIITDKFSGQSKGFGFVEMETDEEAAEAIKNLNGKDMEGRAMVVNVARPQEDRGPRPGGGGNGGFSGPKKRW